MAQLTASSWDNSGSQKKKKTRPVKKPRPVPVKKDKAPKKQDSPAKVSKTPQPRPEKKVAARPVRSAPVRELDTKKLLINVAVVIVLVITAAGAFFAHSRGVFSSSESIDAGGSTSTNYGVIGGPAPDEVAELSLEEVVAAVNASYTPALRTHGSATLDDGRTFDFDTSWIADGSMGRGEVTLGGTKGDVMLYKNVVIAHNGDGLVNDFIGSTSPVTGWVIMVDPSFEQAFPAKSKVAALNATAEGELIFDGNDVTGSGVTATINGEVASKYVTPTLDFAVEPASPGDIAPLSEDFLADGKAEVINDVWSVSPFERG